MLRLDDQEFVEEKLSKLQFVISEYNFINLYLFRKLHSYELVKGPISFIKGITYDQTPFLFPLDLVDDYQVEEMLYPIPDEELNRFKGWGIEEHREDEDYLYLREKLVNYPGRKLAGRRNLVKQFCEKYAYKVERLSESNLHLARTLVEEKQQIADIEEAREALELFTHFKLDGIVVMVEEKPIAYALGSPLTKECYLIHFAKALTGYVGAYQFLYQAFAKVIDPTFKWINMEADMGLEGLRKAKNAYLPDRMEKKWRVKRL